MYIYKCIYSTCLFLVPYQPSLEHQLDFAGNDLAFGAAFSCQCSFSRRREAVKLKQDDS